MTEIEAKKETAQAVAEPPQQAAPEAAQSAAASKAPVGFRHVMGIKKGMTQIYDKDGRLRPVTEVLAGPCAVLRVRTEIKDHYKAVQLGFTKLDESKVSKPLAGQFKAANASPVKYIREIRVSDINGIVAGQVVDLEGRFAPMDYVDVQGTTKGWGFAGVMKRHNFRGLPGSHGASDKERSPGSLTARRALGRVLPGQRMAGHLGHETATVQKIEVIEVNPEKNLIYLYGSVPGPKGSLVLISETVKNKKRRIIRKVSTVLRDKMGNIIKTAGAKKAAAAQAAQKDAAKTEKK